MKKYIALFRYFILREKPKCSTFVDEDTITMGYGKCLSLGDFEYDLPLWVVFKHHGTVSWRVKLYGKNEQK